MTDSSKRGIILMNLGSPDSTSVKDVKRYLNEFLMDERVIDMPYLSRLLLVKGIIVPFRATKSAKAYESVWMKEGSPLIVLSRQLQEMLQKQLNEPVVLAMRYGNPTPRQAFEELTLKVSDLQEVLLVPMYPHYAMSSYETAVTYAREIYKKEKYDFRLKVIRPFYDNEDYLHALSESIRPYLQNDHDHILFSYHGLPERHIHKSDITHQHCLREADCCNLTSPSHEFCYRHQCVFTTNSIASTLRIEPGKFSFSFQSRLGRDEWLKPYTVARLKELPKEGLRKIIIVCPAFVSDCLETLEEIAEEGKEIFLHAGGESFTIIPCLNVQPLWIKALKKWIDQTFAGDKGMLLK